MPPEIGEVQPTLFIGLGGTGKEVLLRLRRRFYERWREVGLPCVRYLWIDTDTRDRLAQNEALDQIDHLLMFNAVESIGLLKGSVGTDLGNIMQNRNTYPHIHEWLPREVESYGTQVADGAGGVRSIGRLAFFRHFPEVKSRIQHLIGEISADAAKPQTKQYYPQGVEVSNNTQVFLVFSVAGGTGGGTFMDVAFLLNNLPEKRSANIETTGIAILPNVYHSPNSGAQGRHSQASAYSALKEIEHFTCRKEETVGADGNGVSPDFDVVWENGRPPLSIPGPPFSVLYLCEKSDERGVPAANRHELFHMIAEHLFSNFTPGQLLNRRKSVFSNAGEDLSRPAFTQVKVSRHGMDKRISLSRHASRRFGSMGLSKVEVPTESIREACAAQLAADIIRHWNRPATDHNLSRRVEGDAPGRFDAESIENLFGTDYERDIKDHLDSLFGTSLNFSGPRDQVKRALDELGERLRTSEDALFREAGQNPSDWGRVKELLHAAVKDCSGKLNQTIEEWVANHLDTPELGLSALVEDSADSKGLIPRLQNYLSEIYRAQSGVAGQTAGVCIAEERATSFVAEAELKEERQDYLLAEMKRTHGSAQVGLLGMRTWTLQRMVDELRALVEDRWALLAQAVLAHEARLVAASTETPLKKLMGDLVAFRNGLDLQESELNTLRREYLNFSKGVRSIRFFNQEEDYPRYYRLGYDEQKHEHKPISARDENDRFAVEKVGKGSRTMEIVRFEADRGMGFLVARLRDFTSERFAADFGTCGDHDCKRMVDVLSHPQSGGTENVAKLLVAGAAAMLRVNADGLKDCRRQAYLSVPYKSEPEYGKLTKLVEEGCIELGYKADQFEAFETRDRSRVQLMLEKFVFPLGEMPHITDECESEYANFYRDRIDAEQKQFKIRLHIDTRWEGQFDDLSPLNYKDDDPRLDAIEILTVGPVLGVIRPQLVEDRREYLYTQSVPPSTQDRTLGNKRHAVELLTADRDLMKSLLDGVRTRHQQAVQFALSKDTQERSKAIDYAWALAYIRYKIFPEGTPERVIADMRYDEVNRAVGADAPEVSNPAKVAETAVKELGNKVAWYGEFPMLEPDQPWIRPA